MKKFALIGAGAVVTKDVPNVGLTRQVIEWNLKMELQLIVLMGLGID